jgi:outer membrane protein assembly factor BamB
MRSIRGAMVFCALSSLGWRAPSASENWAEFRGPGGTGISDATGLPREWSESKNVLWKTPLHGRGWSSPVVWGKQIWMTTGTPDGKELYVLCVDRESGKMLMDHKLFDVPKPNEEWQKFNSYASPTAVMDEGHVFVHFGTYGTACLDMKSGKPLWIRQDLLCNHWRGAGSSPIIFQNLLILTFDGYDVQFLVALEKKSGKTVWKTDRKIEYAKNGSDGDVKKGYSTPIIIEVDGKPQLISPASAAVVSYDPLTGKEIWWVKHGGHSPGARSLFGHGLVYITTGAGKELIAIRPNGKGDVTGSHIAWSSKSGIGHKPSPLLVDDLLYIVDDGGTATCLDAKTGAQAWKQRVGGSYSASPLCADGVIWFFAEDGTATLVQPGREFKELAKNKIDGGKECKSTPAIAGKSLFIRSDSALYRIEQR